MDRTLSIRIPPEPVTVTDFYLAAILDELKAIHVLLDRNASNSSGVAGGQVELKEPARVAMTKRARK
jgi:hypothetical protein